MERLDPAGAEGWRLFVMVSSGIGVAALTLAAARGFDADGLRMAIRLTARTSLGLFLLAFTAGALARLAPGAPTSWLRRHRRFIGLSFAASHLWHAVAIVALAIVAPAELRASTSAASFVFGGIGYAVILALAATSFDRTARWVGPRAWRVLHTVGVHYLWLQFLVAFGMRVTGMPSYAAGVALLIAAMGLRLAVARRSKVAHSG